MEDKYKEALQKIVALINQKHVFKDVIDETDPYAVPSYICGNEDDVYAYGREDGREEGVREAARIAQKALES